MIRSTALVLAILGALGGLARASVLPGSPAGITALRAAAGKRLEHLTANDRCLAEAMYYEARGEGLAGEKAIADVVLRRLHEGRYGHSVCAVVGEGLLRGQCQFSFECDGSLDKPKEPRQWKSACVLAARILRGEEDVRDLTLGATSFHAVYVRPAWAARLVRTLRIGRHVFYRLPYEVADALRRPEQ